jgi:mRNA interferase RelE/StbE
MIRVVRPADQVIEFVKRLAPEPRRAIKRALKDLGRDRGDICPLDGNFTSYYRLRVGRHRVIFYYAPDGAIEAVFVEERSLVYDVFEAEFIAKLKSPLVRDPVTGLVVTQGSAKGPRIHDR